MTTKTNPNIRYLILSWATKKVMYEFNLIHDFNLVEAGRVELPSENASIGTSPGAGGYCGSLTLPVPLPTGKPSRRKVR